MFTLEQLQFILTCLTHDGLAYRPNEVHLAAATIDALKSAIAKRKYAGVPETIADLPADT
jgi:hypothetical protein